MGLLKRFLRVATVVAVVTALLVGGSAAGSWRIGAIAHT